MIRINLLKPGQKDIKEASPAAPAMEFKEKRNQPLFGVIPLLAILAVAALFFYQKGEIGKEKRLLARAQEEKQSLQYVVSKLEELKQKADNLKAKKEEKPVEKKEETKTTETKPETNPEAKAEDKQTEAKTEDDKAKKPDTNSKQ